MITAALIAALVVLLAGGLYASKPRRTYESHRSFVLTPKRELGTAVRAGLLEAFANTSASGTYVELLASRAATAGQGVTMTSRAVPDTRVINLTATGPRDSLVAELHSVTSKVLADQRTLSDLWWLRTIDDPSPPSLTGTSRKMLLLVTGLLALLAAAAVFVVFAQLTGVRRADDR